MKIKPPIVFVFMSCASYMLCRRGSEFKQVGVFVPDWHKPSLQAQLFYSNYFRRTYPEEVGKEEFPVTQ